MVETDTRQTAPTMKAVVCARWGGPEALQLRQVERPDPGVGEVFAFAAGDCEIAKCDCVYGVFAVESPEYRAVRAE